MFLRHVGCVLATLVLVSALGTGCSQIKEPFDPKPTTAEVDFDGQIYSIEAADSQLSKDAVAHMRVSQWDQAIAKLEQRILQDKKDSKSAKALAVAYDKMGNEAKAYEAYTSANLLMKKGGDALVTKRLLELGEKLKNNKPKA